MKQTKLLKSILIPTLGISVIGTIATVSTSCGSENPNVVHVTSVSLNKTSTTLAVGDTETLIATILPENATDKSVTWSSNNESVATVVNGTITAVGLGNATITVTTNDGGLTATCVVTVNSVHITSITLNKTSTTLAVGDTETLDATISPENATDKSVTWSSNNESVAIVNENGTITAVGLGTTNITVRTNDGGLTATCVVTVNSVHITSITLDKTSTTLAVGDTETLIATISPQNATDKSVTWSSNNESVATVVNGTITAVGLGNATITVTTNDGGLTATCVVTVNSVHITSITLNKTSTTLAVGDTETLTATVLPENATDKSVTWSSNNESVAIVNENGKIAAVGVGNATITVRTNDGGLTATCEVNVRNPYVVVAANADSILTLNNIGVGENNPDLQYTTDGTNWTTYSTTININQGQRLYLKGNNPTGWSHTNSSYSSLSITGDVSISGNVMGLLDNGAAPGKEGDITTIPCDYCFYKLFESSAGITSVSEDFLPATNLTKDCYTYMFYQCTSLTTAPDLPATTLVNYCYQNMFWQCTSLSTAPELPATSLAYGCYQNMFYRCTSLTTAPELPATSLADCCYWAMFNYCTSLIEAPELPATTLAEDCYRYMFGECTSLTTAPELPATNLTNYCYSWMFKGCASLKSIKIGYTGNYDSPDFFDWVTGVAGSGTFYYNGNQTAQDFQLPSGWTTEKF